MASEYSTYEAKARFSEILRRVRRGQSVTIRYRGAAVAEIRPLYRARDPQRVLKDLEEKGILSPPRAPAGPIEPLARRPGAVQRFLAERR